MRKKLLRICIGTAPTDDNRLGIGPMLLDTLSRMGHVATLVRDGDPAALESDLLLLTGSARSFRRYPQLLERRRAGRPLTALWLFEPLPAAALNEQAEKTGLRLAQCDLNRLAPPYRSLARLVPFHNNMRDVARWRYAARFKKEARQSGVRDYEPLTPHELYNVMCEYRWFTERYSKQWCDFVFASTLPRCRFLRSKGFPAHFVPMGYHRDWGRDLGLPRDIDVLFLGRTDKTCRRGPLSAVRKDLAARGIEMTVVNKGCFAEERTRLLNRARVVLDIPRLPWEMPLMRLLMSMSCGALVASAWTGDPAPFRAEHLVQAPAPRLAEAVAYYVEHEDARRAIVKAASELIAGQMTLQNALVAIMNAAFDQVPCSTDNRHPSLHPVPPSTR